MGLRDAAGERILKVAGRARLPQVGILEELAQAPGGLNLEYMTAEAAGERLATFPDVITTFSAADERPVSIADIGEGQGVAILAVDKYHVPLGAGVKEPSVYPEVEEMLGKPLAELALA